MDMPKTETSNTRNYNATGTPTDTQKKDPPTQKEVTSTVQGYPKNLPEKACNLGSLASTTLTKRTPIDPPGTLVNQLLQKPRKNNPSSPNASSNNRNNRLFTPHQRAIASDLKSVLSPEAFAMTNTYSKDISYLGDHAYYKTKKLATVNGNTAFTSSGHLIAITSAGDLYKINPDGDRVEVIDIEEPISLFLSTGISFIFSPSDTWNFNVKNYNSSGRVNPFDIQVSKFTSSLRWQNGTDTSPPKFKAENGQIYEVVTNAQGIPELDTNGNLLLIIPNSNWSQIEFESVKPDGTWSEKAGTSVTNGKPKPATWGHHGSDYTISDGNIPTDNSPRAVFARYQLSPEFDVAFNNYDIVRHADGRIKTSPEGYLYVKVPVNTGGDTEDDVSLDNMDGRVPTNTGGDTEERLIHPSGLLFTNSPRFKLDPEGNQVPTTLYDPNNKKTKDGEKIKKYHLTDDYGNPASGFYRNKNKG